MIFGTESHLVQSHSRHIGLIAASIDTIVTEPIVSISGARSSDRPLAFNIVAATTNHSIITSYLILIRTVLLINFIA